MKSVKIGFAPTRRSIFSAPDAVKYANLTRERLKELGVEFVDITDINEEGLFYDEADREKIQEKFRRENVKGIFFPHGNFGTEYVCARLAKEMGLPSHQNPSDRTASVRLLVHHVQRGRAAGKIQHSAFPDSASGTDCGDEKSKSRGQRGGKVVAYCNTNMCVKIKPEELENVAALKVAMKNLAAKYSCNAIAIQCWNALQGEIGIMSCAANSLLNEEGIPVVCETDIHGTITALLVEAAGRNDKRSFFADWTVRHPDNENGELLQHCGPWPISVAQEKPTIGYPLAFSHPGAVEAQAKLGEMTLARFDGDNGEYSLLLGNAKGVEGPYTKGTYVWVEVQNLKRLEAKIVEGPYIHHCVGIHENVVPVLYEACKYIGIAPDLYDPIEEDVKAYLRGE